jgi:dTDP-4-dehydrorhamnose 3,5-epimerase
MATDSLRFTPDPVLPEVIHVGPVIYRDGRGFFQETYHSKKYGARGIGPGFVQDNRSFSTRGVLRGLHFQHPSAQGKLVRVTSGEIFDVAVDIRVGSPRFGRWCAVRLSAEEGRQLYVPPDFAHGFVVLAEAADVEYKCTGHYDPASEHTLLWSDPTVGVEWPVAEPVVSARDAEGLTLEDLQVRGCLPRFSE